MFVFSLSFFASCFPIIIFFKSRTHVSCWGVHMGEFCCEFQCNIFSFHRCDRVNWLRVLKYRLLYIHSAHHKRRSNVKSLQKNPRVDGPLGMSRYSALSCKNSLVLSCSYFPSTNSFPKYESFRRIFHKLENLPKPSRIFLGHFMNIACRSFLNLKNASTYKARSSQATCLH